MEELELVQSCCSGVQYKSGNWAYFCRFGSGVWIQLRGVLLSFGLVLILDLSGIRLSIWWKYADDAVSDNVIRLPWCRMDTPGEIHAVMLNVNMLDDVEHKFEEWFQKKKTLSNLETRLWASCFFHPDLSQSACHRHSLTVWYITESQGIYQRPSRIHQPLTYKRYEHNFSIKYGIPGLKPAW